MIRLMVLSSALEIT